MLPIHSIIWNELRAPGPASRVPEPSEAMEDMDQIRAYMKAYEWGGPTSALQLHHLRELSVMIRPGDTIVDLACGPGPLLLELAPLYPECRFIGADLSAPMLAALQEEARARRLTNVTVLHEDIRHLPGVAEGSVDLVISTSALHHLPDVNSLQQTLARIDRILRDDGGIYLFDFGLLRSPKTRRLMVAEVARKAPSVTAVDYAHSLDAAFPIGDVITLAKQSISRPLTCRSSSFVDFFYFIQTVRRTEPPANVVDYWRMRWRDSPMDVKAEHVMLRLMRRQR